MAARRRWRWVVAILLVLVAVPALGWWLLGDALVVGALDRRLPMRVSDSVVLTRAHARPPAGSVALLLELTPARARVLALAAADRTLPPTVLRTGLTVDGQWSGLDGSAPLPLRVQLGAAEPPQARLALPAAPINALITRHHREEQAGATITYDYRLNPGSIVVDDGAPLAIDGGWRRRFRATASGEVEATLAGDRCLVRVSHVEATIDLDLLRDGDHWRLRGDTAVGRCESTVVESQSTMLRLAAANLPRLLETLLDQSLSAENLAEARLPAWFPHDLRVDGRLE